VRALDSLNPFDPGIRMANAGGITTANIMPGSANVIGGQTIYVKLRGYSPEQMWVGPSEVLGGLKTANGENPKRAYGDKGKDADFVILSGEPFSVYTRVLETYIDGRRVFALSDDRERCFQTGGFALLDRSRLPAAPALVAPPPSAKTPATPAVATTRLSAPLKSEALAAAN
jgi:hypothetical protein